MNISRLRAEQNRKAFSLLEILVSMSIMVILFTLSVNALVTVNELGEELVEVHHEGLFSNAFYTACKNGFDSMGRQSQVEFEYAEREAGVYDTYLTLTNSPEAFQVNFGQTRRVDHVCLAAELRADGWLRVGVYYFSDEDYQLEKRNKFSSLQSIPYLKLIDRAQTFRWYFYDANRSEWLSEIDGFIPHLIKLEIVRPDSPARQSYIFPIR